MIGAVTQGEMLNLADMMEMLEETSHVIEYSQQLQHTTAELRAANARLQELDRLKDEFLSTVSHELRTPLTAIRSASEILADNQGLPPEQAQRFLAIIVSESERLTRLIDKTLDLARLTAGQAEWRIEALDPAAVAADAAAAVEPLAREKNVLVTLDLSGADVRADRDRLMQVFVNLLSNAVKFVPAGNGRVHVSARLDGGEWRASVADNGPGIPAGDRERIFDRFVQTRLDGTRSGTGLGLAISRRIVAHFGGRITAETPAKKGALFVLALPATAALRARPAPLIGPGSAAQADAAPAAR